MSNSYLAAEDVSKRYGAGPNSFTALRGVTVTVDQGEFLAIRGPSGCGKSTLLHILGAMDRPSHGKAWLNGSRLDNLEPEALAAIRRNVSR